MNVRSEARRAKCLTGLWHVVHPDDVTTTLRTEMGTKQQPLPSLSVPCSVIAGHEGFWSYNQDPAQGRLELSR